MPITADSSPADSMGAKASTVDMVAEVFMEAAAQWEAAFMVEAEVMLEAAAVVIAEH
jgi:hypothetical protein